MRSTGRPAGKTPLDKIIEVITRSADPDRIILFGSRARKDNKKTSDYDICVLKHGVSRRRQLAMKLYRDVYGIGVPVELIVETPEMFEKIKDNPFLIYHAIAHQGKVIYEKPDRFEAPNWMPDGKKLIFNMEGSIYKIPVEGGAFDKLNTGFADKNNIDQLSALVTKQIR